jgi:sterol O-acyltransferase
VSKREHRQFKTLFKPRTSLLDIETLIVEKHPLRGFFVLFWISIAFRIVVSMYQRWRTVGTPVSIDLALVMTDNVNLFFKAEILMMSSLFYAPVYQKLVTWRIVPLSLSRILQHTIQAAWFLGICSWILSVDLQWTQSMTFTLHTIAMLMKQYSYNSYNIDLHFKLHRFKQLKSRYETKKKQDEDDLNQEEIQEMNDLNDELCAGGDIFPANQTFRNFFVLLF